MYQPLFLTFLYLVILLLFETFFCYTSDVKATTILLLGKH